MDTVAVHSLDFFVTWLGVACSSLWWWAESKLAQNCENLARYRFHFGENSW